MNDLFTIDLSKVSLLKLFWVFILGAIIFLAIKLFKNYLIHLIIKSPIKKKKIKAKIPVFEIILWILYVIYVLYIFLSPFPFLGAILFLVILYLSRNNLINLIQGLFFRLKSTVTEGEKVIIKDVEGVINSLNVFDISFENKEGEISLISYKELLSINIVKKDFSTDFLSHNFSITTNLKLDYIKNKIINLPWSSELFPPKITSTSVNENDNQFNIIVYSIDRRYFSFIETAIRKEIG